MNSPPDRTGVVERYFWARHANPGSVWTLVAAYPVLVLALYRRSRPLLGATLLFVLLNPLLFSPPDDDGAWATRVVRGERVWLDRGLGSSPGDLLFVTLAAPLYLFTIRAAVDRRPVHTAVGTAVGLVLMLLFFGRMARQYERRADR
jgi:hypothetical protein